MAIPSWQLKWPHLLASVVCIILTAVTSLEDKCYVRPHVEVPDADVQFGLLLSLRSMDTATTGSSSSDEQRTTCGPIRRPALEQFLAVQWLVGRVNAYSNGTGYIPGIKLGFQVLDDCGSALYASRNALTFLDQWSPRFDQCSASSASSGQDGKPEPIGLVGTSNSDIAMEVASLVRQVPLPVVSMAATIPELSDKQRYPTFLRTVPSDELHMDAIASMLRQLNWTYIAVIHSNTNYGHAASTSLAQKAAKHGICIQKTLALTRETLDRKTFSNYLEDLLQKSLNKSLAVVFIGSSVDADYLLLAIDHLEHMGGQEVKYGMRVILARTSSTSVDTSVFDRINEGTLAVGGTEVDMSADLEKEVRALVTEVKNGAANHSLIEEYLGQGSPDGDIFPASSRSSLVPLSLHAVMALVEGLRAAHSEACKGAVGVCPTMIPKILKATQKTILNYTAMSPGIAPAAFKEKNLVLSFDEQGDITLPGTTPAYTVHQYRKSTNKYEQVGYYQGAKTVLNKSLMHWLTPSGQTTMELPTSLCDNRCDQHCLPAKGKGALPLVILPGRDGYILGLFSIHDTLDENPFECGNFRFSSNDPIVAEGFLYAVQRLRQMTGLDIGAVAIDDCYSPLRTLSVLHDLFSGLPSADLSAFPKLGNFRLDQVVGVIACRSSGCTIPVARFFMQLDTPVVSYAASSPDLDDKADFPYFLRTVPSDVYQAKVMLDIIRVLGWEYVGLLYVNNNYGIKAMQAFKQLAMESRGSAGVTTSDDESEPRQDRATEGEGAWQGVCVAEEIAIEERASQYDGRNFFTVWKRLSEQGVKIVVFFGIDSRYRHFLSYLEDGKHSDFIFLASEEWATNQEILKTSPLAARGAITLKVEEVDLEDVEAFQTYLLKKQPSLDDNNIWYWEFWQRQFQCNLPGGFINTYPRTCAPDLKLNSSEVAWRTNEQRFRHTMNAVYAMGKGLQQAAHQLCERDFPCPYLRLKAAQLTNMIRGQSRKAGSLKFPVFDKDGNGALGFEVFNVQKLGRNQYSYVKVGTFNSGSTPTFEKDKLKFYTDTGGVFTSANARCTPVLCGHCPAPPSVPKPSEQLDCPTTYKESDIVIISLIGVLILALLVAIAAIVLCYCKNWGTLKKHLLSREEQIYDEPERQVYPQYMDTHGFRFANLNIEPLLGGNQRGAGIGYEQSAIDGGEAVRAEGHAEGAGGFHNDAYVHDHVDSVSQIFSRGSPHHHHHQHLDSQGQGQIHGSQPQPAMGTDMVRSRSRSFQVGAGASPSPSQRLLPVSPMGATDTMSNIMHDNMAYHDGLSGVGVPRSRKMASASNTPTHTASSSASSINNNSNNNRITTSPSRSATNNTNTTNTGAISPGSCSNNSYLSNTSGATMNSSQATTSPFYPPPQQQQQQQQQYQEQDEPGVVYYMQDSNGQLAAHITPSPPAERPMQDVRVGQQVALPAHIIDGHNTSNHAAPQMMHQMSNESDQSSVHADYGPYSSEAAVKRAMQQQQHQQQKKQQNIAHHLPHQQYLPGQDQNMQRMQQFQQQPPLQRQHHHPNANLYQQKLLQQYQQQQQQHLQQYQHEQVPAVPTSQPPRPPISRSSVGDLQDMPGKSFFIQPSQQHQQHQQQQQQNHLHNQQQQPLAQLPHHNEQQHLYHPPPPPPPHEAEQHLLQALQQTHLQHTLPSHHQFAAPSESSDPSTPSTRRAATQNTVPLTEIQTLGISNGDTSNASSPISNASDSDGQYVDTAIGSSLSPGLGQEAAVDLDFQPALSHDPRPPNDIYLESIDLESTLPSDPYIPEVSAISPSSRRRGNNTNNRSELVALSVLSGNVSKV